MPTKKTSRDVVKRDLIEKRVPIRVGAHKDKKKEASRKACRRPVDPTKE